MRWTPGARSAVKHALIQTSDDEILAAIDYAEQLAKYVGASIVDTDLWIQALIRTAHRHDLPPSESADAS
jgi:hypothetical protein